MYSEDKVMGYEKDYPDAMKAARELTVGELLDRRIEKARQLAKTLEDLKCSLSLSYLNSGCSRITSFIEL